MTTSGQIDQGHKDKEVDQALNITNGSGQSKHGSESELETSSNDMADNSQGPDKTIDSDSDTLSNNVKLCLNPLQNCMRN